MKPGIYEPNGSCPKCNYTGEFDVDDILMQTVDQRFQATVEFSCPECDLELCAYPETSLIEVSGE